jgi:transducin (beta)-like 1
MIVVLWLVFAPLLRERANIFPQLWGKPTKGSSPEATLEGHQDSVVSICWQPLPADSSLPPSRRILASASHDCTVRLWDAISKTCVQILRLHIDPIERISFSPDGSRIASGANGKVIVWKTETGAVTHVYDGLKGRRKNGKISASAEEGEIGEISWDEAGVRVAVGGGEAKVCPLILFLEVSGFANVRNDLVFDYTTKYQAIAIAIAVML